MAEETTKMNNHTTAPLLEVQGLKKYFFGKGKKEESTVYALNDITFSVNAGETFGLVGESGCGKNHCRPGDYISYETNGGKGCI